MKLVKPPEKKANDKKPVGPSAKPQVKQQPQPKGNMDILDLDFSGASTDTKVVPANEPIDFLGGSSGQPNQN